MRHNKFSSGLLLTLLIAVFSLANCRKKDDGQATPEPAFEATIPPAGTLAPTSQSESVIITFGCYDYERETYEELVRQFEAIDPGISVQLVSLDAVLERNSIGRKWPSDTWQRLAAAADTTVFWVDPGSIEQGLVQDLSGFINADPSFRPDDFYPNMLESFQWDGGIWALPAGAELQLIFYDKDAFDAAGVTYPALDWTWNDFLAKARAMTEHEGEQVSRYGYVEMQGLGLARAYLLDHGGPLLDKRTGSPLLDRPGAAQAARWYIDLVEVYQVTPYTSPDQDRIETMQLIEDRKVAMWSDSSENWRRWEQSHNLGLAPYPSDGKGTTYLAMRGYMMSAGTLHPQESWRWLDFLTQQPPPGSSNLIPARRSVAERTGYWDSLPPEVAQVYRHALEHSQTPVGRAEVVLEAFGESIHAVLQKKEELGAALAEAQAQAIHQLSAQMERGKGTPVPVATPQPERPLEVTTIGFAPFVGYGDFKVAAFRRLAEQFNTTNPDIEVEIQPPAMDDQPSTIAEAAQGIDCFAWFPFLESAADRAAILELGPFVDADPTFETRDFYPLFWEQCQQQGHLWGLPAEGWPRLLYYNKTLFDAAGIAYPTLDWTLDDFLVKAKALTQGEEDTRQYGFVPEAVEMSDLILFVYQQGGRFVDENADPMRFLYDTPATVAAVEWYVDLSRVHGVKPVFQALPTGSGPESGYEERYRLIHDGRAAMWTGYGRTSPHDPWAELEAGVAPLPRGEEPIALTTVLAYFISAETESPWACWEWLAFLTRQLGPAQGMPARQSLAESSAYRQQVGEEVAAAYLAAVQGKAFGRSVDQPWSQVPYLWFAQAYDAIVEGEVGVETALANVQAKAEAYQACIATSGHFEDEETWKQCAAKIDPETPVQLLE